MNELQPASQGNNVANVIAVINQSALQWVATLKGVPIRSGQPDSVMRNVFGTDLGGGPTVEGQTLATLGPIVVIALVVGAVVMMVKR